MTINPINTTLDDGTADNDERTRTDIANDIANAINEHCDGHAKEKTWTEYGDDDGEIRVDISGGSKAGYGHIVVRENGTFYTQVHRASGTNIVEVIIALGGEYQ